MTFVSVAQASRRLGVDAKTLHSSAQDGRKKGVSSDHLHVLARLHQRSLTPLPEVPPAPIPAEAPELSAALLALPERLAALQQQVADLTLLLKPQAPAPVSPAPTAQPSRRSSKPAPRSRPAAKTPRKPVHVIPRVEYGEQGHYVVICPKYGLLPFEPDTPEWFV